MKQLILSLAIALSLAACSNSGTGVSSTKNIPDKVTLTKAQLLDKIKGGWAGQTIGCTYGGPTEFKYPGTMIQDYIPIPWPDGITTR